MMTVRQAIDRGHIRVPPRPDPLDHVIRELRSLIRTLEAERNHRKRKKP